MSEWKECTIGDLCDTISDTYKRNDETVILINTSDVLEGNILNHQPVPNKNLKGQFKKTFKKNDILYSEIRPANKRFAFIDFENTEKYIASTKLMVLRPRKNVVLPQFLFSILKSREIIEKLQHLAETRSGTFPQITFTSELSPIKVMLPDLVTQEKISSILSALDDKIELNNRINENLEQQAQAIFKSWFVDFEPNAKLEDIAYITMGQSPKGTSYNENGIGEVFFQGRTDFGYRFPTIRMYTTEPKKIAKKGDILLSVRAPVGDINVADRECCIGRGLASIRSKTKHSSFLLYTMLNVKSQLDLFNGEGTVFGCINQKALNEINVIKPDIALIEKFEKTVSPLDRMIENNSGENQRLSALRDAFLQKLMNGEIDVENVKI